MTLMVTGWARAQPISWEPVGGPPGVSCNRLAHDPATGRVLMAATRGGGYNVTTGAAYMLDPGGTWQPASSETQLLANNSSIIRAIACAPGNVVYFALQGGGVYRSVDGGAHGAPFNGGLPSSQVNDASASGGKVYACVNGAGVYQLNAAGTAWALDSTGVTSTAVQTIEPVGASWLVGTTGGGVFARTGNSGAWATSNSGLGNLNVTNLVAGSAAGEVYACTDAGLYTSTNSGASWSAVAGPFSATVVNACAASGGALVVSTTTMGVFRRATAASPWTTPANAEGFTGKIARVLLTRPGEVWMGADAGVFRSLDDGATWAALHDGLPGQTVTRVVAGADGTLLAGTLTSGLYRRAPGAAQWDEPDLKGRLIFALTQSPWGDYYAGNYTITSGVSDGHAWRSIDGGQTWAPLDSGLVSAMVSGFAFTGVPGEVLVTSAWNPGGVHTSIAYGASWSRVGPPPNIAAYFLGRASNGDLFIGSEGQGVWRMNAATLAWTNLGFTSSQQFAVAFSAQGSIFFGNDGHIRGVYRSSDGGQSFQPLNGYPSLYAYALLALPDGRVLTGGRDAGIQVSSDDGDTWSTANAGMPGTVCYWLALGPDGRAYAATPIGLYRSVGSIVSVACGLADVTSVGGTGEAPGAPDGQLTVDDIIVFVNVFSDSTGCPAEAPCSVADVCGVGGPPETPDGQLTVDDVIAFFNAFSDGC